MADLGHIMALNIKERRRFLGFSQAKLAERANTAPTYIAMLELEKRTPSLDMIEKIALALNIAPSELFKEVYPSEAVNETPYKDVIDKFHEAVLAEFEEILSGIAD